MAGEATIGLGGGIDTTAGIMADGTGTGGADAAGTVVAGMAADGMAIIDSESRPRSPASFATAPTRRASKELDMQRSSQPCFNKKSRGGSGSSLQERRLGKEPDSDPRISRIPQPTETPGGGNSRAHGVTDWTRTDFAAVRLTPPLSIILPKKIDRPPQTSGEPHLDCHPSGPRRGRSEFRLRFGQEVDLEIEELRTGSKRSSFCRLNHSRRLGRAQGMMPYIHSLRLGTIFVDSNRLRANLPLSKNELVNT